MAPWFYRALESVSMASALSTALTIYPCQIRVHQTLTVLNSNLILTARKKEWWPATADSLPQAVYLTTVKHTTLVGIEPTTFRSWVRRATSCATETMPLSLTVPEKMWRNGWHNLKRPLNKGQGSFTLVSIDSTYTTSYRLSIVTFALGRTV